MKKTFLATALIIALTITTTTNAQVGIGVSTANINPSAQLDVTSTTKGFLPPRMTASQRDAITSPAQGLVIYCTNCGGRGVLEVYNGNSWINITGSAAFTGSAAADSYLAYHWVYSGVSGTYQLYSFDGTTWTSISSNTPSGNLGNNTYIGVINGKAYHWVYYNGTSQLYSFDGTTWTSISSNTPSGNLGGGDKSYIGVIGNTIYQLVYNGTYTLYSFNGTTWTLVNTNMPTGNLNSGFVGSFSNKIYKLIYFNGAYSLYSFDGITWTNISSGSNSPSVNLGWLLDFGPMPRESTFIGVF